MNGSRLLGTVQLFAYHLVLRETMTYMQPAKDASRSSLYWVVTRSKPIGPAFIRVHLQAKSHLYDVPKLTADRQTFRPIAKSRSNLMQRLWHDFSKPAILLSLLLKGAGSACWALPFLNSPKFIALSGTLELSRWFYTWVQRLGILFEVSSLKGHQYQMNKIAHVELPVGVLDLASQSA